MHVKRHLSRLFGSLRRKDHKNLGGKVLEQLQSRENKTSSRWELLDYDQQQNFEDGPEVSTHLVEPFTTYLYKDQSATPDKKENYMSLSYQEVQVELNRHNSISPSSTMSKRLRNQPKDCSSNTIKELQNENYENYYKTWDSTATKSVPSVVKQINETISLISKFRPEETDDSAIGQGFDEADANCSKKVILFTDSMDNEVKSVSDDNNLALTTNATVNSLSRNNPDTIWNVVIVEKEDEGTRLTRGISSQSSQREAINLAQNEATRVWTVFALDDDQQTGEDIFEERHGPLAMESSSQSSTRRHIGGGESDDVARISSTTTNVLSTSPLSASRPGAESEEMSTSTSSFTSRTGIRNSGRKLYNKIHKRFNRKSKETIVDSFTTNTANTSATFSTTTNTTDNSTLNNTSTFSEQQKKNKEKEVKSIENGLRNDKNNTVGGIGSGARRRLTRSFRKAISFPRSAFQPLDDDANVKDSQRKKNPIEQGGVLGVSSSRTTNSGDHRCEMDVTVVDEEDLEGGPVKVRRKLSIKALQRPGKGMGKILKKGVSAFGKSMIHASAVMPIPYECPQSNYSPTEPYWEDEDYFYEFRRYCQSAELDYQKRFSETQKFYQHGYCQ